MQVDSMMLPSSRRDKKRMVLVHRTFMDTFFPEIMM
jgi:hypothetical protein